MMFWYGGHWEFWQGALMWVGMIAFWGVVIWAGYTLFTRLGRFPAEPDNRPDRDSARRILDERFARGEIDAEEYHQRLDVLESSSHRPTTGAGAR